MPTEVEKLQLLLLLINDILDLAKVEAGKEELVLIPISVSKPVLTALLWCRSGPLNKAYDSSAISKTSVASSKSQILINLLSNAIKFTSVGDVSLSVQKQPQGLTFTLSDTGIGMAEAQLPLLFQPSVQLDGRLNQRYEGTGLGLALACELVQLHGGDIYYRQVNVRAGQPVYALLTGRTTRAKARSTRSKSPDTLSSSYSRPVATSAFSSHLSR